jgi:hypothetical protein
MDSTIRIPPKWRRTHEYTILSCVLCLPCVVSFSTAIRSRDIGWLTVYERIGLSMAAKVYLKIECKRGQVDGIIKECKREMSKQGKRWYGHKYVR